MQNYTSNELSCSVYGHNLQRSTNDSQTSHKLICKTCSAEIAVSADGEFDTHPVKNRRLIFAIRDYFILKNNRLQRQLSY